MSPSDALVKWGYSNSRKKLKALSKICEDHSDLCVSIAPLIIKEKAKKPYLPDERHNDTYTHIVCAVSSCSHLHPESIGITEERLIDQLYQLRKEGIIEKSNKKKKSATENYSTTLKTQDWMIEREKAHWKPFLLAAKIVKPDFVAFKQE